MKIHTNYILNRNSNIARKNAPKSSYIKDFHHNVYKLDEESYIYNGKNYFNSFGNTISFLGKAVHIVDGGSHAKNMKHFARAISNDMDIEMHEVETNKKNTNTKQLKSLEQELFLLNQKPNVKNQYIAIPALASIALLNLQQQYNWIMQDKIKLTPENIKMHKKELLNFLKAIYENPDKYRQCINYMDEQMQGIEYTYGVIQQINNLITKGAKIYIPSGHPQDGTLKWMAEERGLKEELYHYIATGEDIHNSIKYLNGLIKSRNWYEFNLLALTEANIVGIKGVDGNDYIFSAYDSCITDGARGVYNFSPIRKNGDHVGYSYTDTYTNEYPVEEFPANDQLKNLLRFVGRQADDVIANKNEISKLRKILKSGESTENCADKLYPIEKIYSKEQIAGKKMNIRGKYIDKTLTLFFDKNERNEIVFQRCNCEGSSKPSVLSMWGNCFSVFNAIKRDIYLEKLENAPTEEEHKQEMQYQINGGDNNTYYDKRINKYNNAINLDKSYALKHPEYLLDYVPYYKLGNLFYENNEYDNAMGCYNIAINLLAKDIFKKNSSLSIIKDQADGYLAVQKQGLAYISAIKEYRSKSLFARLFTPKPLMPEKYNYMQYADSVNLYKKAELIGEIYEKMAIICEKRHELYASKICKMAVHDIMNCTEKADEIITRRKEGIQYLGDIYNEIKPY